MERWSSLKRRAFSTMIESSSGDEEEVLDVLAPVQIRVSCSRRRESLMGFPAATNGHVRLDRMPSSTISRVALESGCSRR